jgi:hypothetical protein
VRGFLPSAIALTSAIMGLVVGGCSLMTSLDGLSQDDTTADGSSPPPPRADADRADGAAGDDTILADDAGLDGAQDDADASAPPPDAAPSPCADGGILCNGACVDPTTDPSNCNGCGNVCASGQCGAAINESMAAAPTLWRFNGSARYNSSAPSGELTVASVNYQSGTMIYQRPIAVDAFTADFSFRIGLQGGTRSDGMGFMLETTGPSAVGGSGSGLGMSGLAGYGVELDIYDNGGCGDTNGDHVGIDDLRSCSVTGGPTSILASPDLSATVDLGDTHWHTAHVALAAGAMSVTIDTKPILTSVPLPGFQPGAAYYFGFAGATGGLVMSDGSPGGYRQEVKNIAITFPSPRCL